ncbi:NADPH-dependent methylglyoxal reductase GRP2 [Ceratobasidium theobromae]|uniref:NADPH-dependent methylglyoxal reductase GRP2 n=1 Tax=Ceratobasidium theobromae TaxID=1582974 RepID=A0A5N5QPZ6_9AGAM|nr:NADPH-dependent methylglyoxal reductase GRP2 [Ceratobasidium theobromae]
MPNNVLLTGGNGFIAVHIISILLERGHTITTTVRAENKSTFLRHKFSTATQNGQLKFAIIDDITKPGTFDQLLKNNSFDTILHTSSPFVFKINDITDDLLTPAIKGTTEILKAAKIHGPTVKRVVITSSFASIVDRSKGNRPGYAYSEKDWNPITYEQSQKDPVSGYYGSKKLAEKAAWDFVEAEKPHYDLVTLCPPMVYGPVTQEVTDMKKLNTSSAPFYEIFSGQTKELAGPGVWLWVDVRDIARAHVLAIEKPEARNNRFLVSGGTFNIGQVADFIWKHYPERAQAKGVPKSTPANSYPEEGTYYPDTSKSKTILGLEYNSFEKMLKDQMDQFLALEKQLGVE